MSTTRGGWRQSFLQAEATSEPPLILPVGSKWRSRIQLPFCQQYNFSQTDVLPTHTALRSSNRLITYTPCQHTLGSTALVLALEIVLWWGWVAGAAAVTYVKIRNWDLHRRLCNWMRKRCLCTLGREYIAAVCREWGSLLAARKNFKIQLCKDFTSGQIRV